MLSKDPVKNFEAHLLSLGVVDEAGVAELQGRVEHAFETAHAYALASPFPERGDVSKGVWVEDGYWRSEPGRNGGTEGT